MKQGLSVEPSSMQFPVACYMVASGKAVEGLIENQQGLDEFRHRHGDGRVVQVFHTRRLPELSS